jgi:hypothetical protein
MTTKQVRADELTIHVALDMEKVAQHLAGLRLLCSHVGYALDTAILALGNEPTEPTVADYRAVIKEAMVNWSHYSGAWDVLAKALRAHGIDIDK